MNETGGSEEAKREVTEQMEVRGKWKYTEAC